MITRSDDQAARTQIFLEAQRLRDDLEIGHVADAQGEDREVARNRHRPQRRLRAEAGRDRLLRHAQEAFRIDQVAGQALHVGGIRKAEAEMPRLHLRARPGQHGLAGKALGMIEQRHGRLDFLAVCADDGPEGQLDLLVGRHAHLLAQRHDRIEHEALAAFKDGSRLEGCGIGDGAATADEARRSVSASVWRATPVESVTKCAAAMSASPGARLRRLRR